MTEISCDPMCRNKTTSGRMLGVCYILSMTSSMHPIIFFLCGPNNSWADRRMGRGPNDGGQTYPWFCAWVLHMVLGMMVFCPWYFVDLVKLNTIMF